ncbi:hypothetical protein E4T56_gene822 [Termitomyces sp. T112]|nr:hypothetical protein E4T56_gene822 [Termitomyces sp. T112]
MASAPLTPASTGPASPSLSTLTRIAQPTPDQSPSTSYSTLKAPKSASLFIINVQPDNSPTILPTLIDSGASGTFVSNQLNLPHSNFNKLLELQLFNRSPASTRITQYHNNALILNNDLRFQVWLLVTQLPKSTLILFGLPWLQDINSDIDWKNLTMYFPSPEASLAATVPLHIQSFSNSEISNLSPSDPGATQTPSALKDD